MAATRPDLRLRLEGVDSPDLLSLIDDVAVVLANHVDYRTGGGAISLR